MNTRPLLVEDVEAAFPSASPDIEALVALVEGCAAHGVARRALLVDLGRLPTALARVPYLRLIAGALDPLLGHDRARLFRLADGHLVLVWRGADDVAVERTTAALTRLFADLPGEGGPPFRLVDLPRDTEAVTATIDGSVAPVDEAPALSGARPLDPATLAALEQSLAQVDLAPFSRRLPVCAWPAGGAPRMVWESRTLALPQLALALAGGGATPHLTAEPWLYRRLTRTLDRRMLALLTDRRELAGAGPFSLSLNVASVLSPEFLRFDEALPAALRGEVVLELSAADVLSDAAAFVFARDWARARHYRTALWGVPLCMLAVLPAATLEVDVVQLRASAELQHGARLPDGAAPGQIVLGGVANASLLDWGRRQGIGLFQGPLVAPTADAAPRAHIRRRAA